MSGPAAGGGRWRELARGVRTNFRYSNGLALTWRRLLRRGAAETEYVWKNRIRVRCDCRRGEHFGLHEILVDDVYGPWLERCTFPDGRVTAVDAGANVGAFTLGLAARGLAVGPGLAVELNPETAARCRGNLARNGLAAVRTIGDSMCRIARPKAPAMSSAPTSRRTWSVARCRATASW